MDREVESRTDGAYIYVLAKGRVGNKDMNGRVHVHG